MSKRIVSLGYARVHFDTVDRHLLVDTDTLRRYPVEESWDEEADEDVGAEEFGYDPDDDDFGDDDWDDDDFGDDDWDDDDDFGD
ncbi:hypothetical protein H8E07_11955, partial [bacterium]|nr:hypothetical protein [bacterium]